MGKKLKIHHLSFIIGKTEGFTLIELLVAIAIIGILSAFLMANFVGVRQRARDGVRKSDLRQIQSALELYRSDKGTYPTTALTCASQFDDGATTPVVYMKKIPCDPSSTTPATSYQYNSAAGSTYCLRTCFENKNDGDRDEMKIGSDNPSITGCTLSACDTDTGNQRSYTLQNP